MALSYEEIRKRINEPRKRSEISLALLHQNRIKFHVQTRLTPCLFQSVNDFFAFVHNLLPRDKEKMFKTLFRFPVKTNEVTSICFDKLSRIFEGKNPLYSYQFTNSEYKDDFAWYRADKLQEPKIWATKGWEFFKTEINSVLIVDVPNNQTTELPEPYFYWLPIGDVINFDADRTTGQMRWIIFRQDDDKICVIDDVSYRVFKGKTNIETLESENFHDLGFCPARFFWNEAISLERPDVKASPITKVLDSLDWFLFYAISKRHLDLYGSYPIYSGYEQACDFHNDESGDYCDGGFLRNRQGQYLFDSAGMLLPCPKCGQKRIIGAGSFVEIPVPTQDGQPDLKNPVQMLAVDRNSLDYNTAEVERLRTEIITSVVGTNEEITTRDALNEQQIRANFESQTTVLNRIKKGFEEAMQWVDSTVCKLRYGDSFVSCAINLGTDFYLYDVQELRNQYKTAKEIGSSEAELDALQKRIIETEYRNDPEQLQRMLLFADLEPYRHLTRNEVKDLYEKELATKEDYLIKLNFANLVSRFERENMNIVEFGGAIPYDKKIQIINQKFVDYVS